MRTHAFTLVELLVVVAIIVVLLALLVPSLDKAIRATEKAVCAAHMHGWGLSLAQYAVNNKQYFPNNSDGVDMSWCGATVQKFWTDYMVGYSVQGDNKMLDCPTQTHHPQVRRANNANGLIGYFYLPARLPGASGAVYDPPSNPNGKAWVSKQRYGQFAAAPILIDMKQSASADGGATHTWANNGIPYSSHSSRPDGSPDGGNFLFEGGQVLWYETDKISVGGTAGGYAWYKIPEVN